MMVPFQLSTLPVTPWKNGGGETREIICVPAPDAPFLWRASIATLQADGPFSPFVDAGGDAVEKKFVHPGLFVNAKCEIPNFTSTMRDYDVLNFRNYIFKRDIGLTDASPHRMIATGSR